MCYIAALEQLLNRRAHTYTQTHSFFFTTPYYKQFETPRRGGAHIHVRYAHMVRIVLFVLIRAAITISFDAANDDLSRRVYCVGVGGVGGESEMWSVCSCLMEKQKE